MQIRSSLRARMGPVPDTERLCRVFSRSAGACAPAGVESATAARATAASPAASPAASGATAARRAGTRGPPRSGSGVLIRHRDPEHLDPPVVGIADIQLAVL